MSVREEGNGSNELLTPLLAFCLRETCSHAGCDGEQQLLSDCALKSHDFVCSTRDTLIEGILDCLKKGRSKRAIYNVTWGASPLFSFNTPTFAAAPFNSNEATTATRLAAAGVANDQIHIEDFGWSEP